MEQSISSKSKKDNNSQNTAQDEGVYLGRTRVYEPTSKDGVSSGSKKESAPDKDGVIDIPKSSSDNRILRFSRQSSSQELLPNKRVGKCLKTRIAKTVKVLKSKTHNKCHFGDLMICGSVWDCPVCAGKISERRRIELKRAVDQFKSFGGSVYLITFTYSHKKHDVLKDLLVKQSKASEWFYRHRTYKEIAKRYQKQGRVRALEVNHGENGWHPHLHELWFLDLHLQDLETLQLEIFNLWVKACKRFGLGIPSWEHGVDVSGGDDAAKYIAKYGLEKKQKSREWGVEDEITKASSKKAHNGSRSSFQLLDDYLEGDKQAGALFVEYSKAFHRKKQLTWSRGLKAMFDLDTMSDEELAMVQDDEAKLLTTIEPNRWSAIIGTSSPKQDNRVIVLTLAENGGVDAMNLFIDDLVARYKPSQ